MHWACRILCFRFYLKFVMLLCHGSEIRSPRVWPSKSVTRRPHCERLVVCLGAWGEAMCILTWRVLLGRRGHANQWPGKYMP